MTMMIDPPVTTAEEQSARRPTRRMVIVVRADPVICGHSGEARNLAEVALTRGFDDVRIVTWQIDTLRQARLPLKPLDTVLPYSDGITVERPAPVGDYKVPDGRYLAGISGRLVELFTDGVPTVCMSLYLSPHTTAVIDARRTAAATGLPMNVHTIAEAVGSDITNVVRSCVDAERFGAAAQLFATYLANDQCVAVSEFTKMMIVDAAAQTDAALGTKFAAQCDARVAVSYPAIDSRPYVSLGASDVERAARRRGLEPGGYVLYLSRLSAAKGVEDLISGFARSRIRGHNKLVIAGNGPEAVALRAWAGTSPAAEQIVFLDDVDDAEKPALMAGSAAFVLPSKPRPEFVETFGIALAEKMLAGGGPVITTRTGGIPEAVGDHALIVPTNSPQAIADALDSIGAMSDAELDACAAASREYAMQFDRVNVFDKLMAHAPALL